MASSAIAFSRSFTRVHHVVFWPPSFRSISTSKEGGELISMYNRMSAQGSIKEDVHQVNALLELDRLRNALLKTYKPPPPTAKEEPSSSSVLGGLFGGSSNAAVSPTKTLSPPKGVYLHGGVGCGKTFCMNLFYDSMEGTDWKGDKQKVHFHKFMLGVHQQMHEAKMVERVEGDVLPRVIEKTLEKGRLICFDEFQVTDVADALILRRLFTGLLEQGCVVVATSNRPPQDLYLNGLQRDLFLPFIDLLEQKLEIVGMWDSTVDYRLVQAETKAKGVYFVGKESYQDFDDVFYKLINNAPVSSTLLSTQGRHVAVPICSLELGVARFHFQDLCTKALGAADYLVIGQQFHTVFVENIPKLTRHELNWVRRLIVFVDAMYEMHVKLVVQAETGINDIFTVNLEDQHNDEVFAFDRTQSRLQEMSSDAYLRKQWAGSSHETVKVQLMVEPSLSEDVK